MFHAFLQSWFQAASDRPHALQMILLADLLHSFLDGTELPIAIAYDVAALETIGIAGDEISAAARALAAADVIGLKELDAKRLLVSLPWLPDGEEKS